MDSEANMSGEQYYLVHRMYCYLCGTTIDRKYADHPTESWRACAQELTLRDPGPGEGPLVEPGLCPLTIRGEPRCMHQACFGVLHRLLSYSDLSAAQLDGLLDCARDIEPFLPQIPSGAAPDGLDEDLAARNLELGPKEEGVGPADAACYDLATLTEEGIQASALVSLIKHDLPPNLHELALQALDPDFDADSCPDPQVSDFIRAAQLLQGLAPFNTKPQDELVKDLTQALSNFNRGGVSRFPRTANFDVVRANALTIVYRLLSIPLEEGDSADWKDGKRPKLEQCRGIPVAGASGSPALYVRLYTLRRDHYAGEGEDGRRVGGKYLRDLGFAVEGPEGALRVPVDLPCGLEFVRDNAVGVVSVRVKDSGGWKTAFERGGISWDDEAKFPRSRVEWPAGSAEGEFFVIADVCTPPSKYLCPEVNNFY